MDRGRLRFFLALALFAGWAIGLGAMAWLSADRPRPRPPTPVAR
jgi:hypothetical protein